MNIFRFFYKVNLRFVFPVAMVLSMQYITGCMCHKKDEPAMNENERKVNNYLYKIRSNTALLTAFFNEMPKGGDLHNHLTGSVYTETYINYVVDKDYYINLVTLEVEEKKEVGSNWTTFSALKKDNLLDAYKEKLMQKWSVKDYNHVSYPCDKQFFETFPAFNIATKGEGRTDSFIMELKHRAIKEHVSYIELMTVASAGSIEDIDTAWNAKLEMACSKRDTNWLYSLLDSMYSAEKGEITHYADSFCKAFTAHHQALKIDDSLFTMRYLFCVSRVLPPAMVFKNMMLAFTCAADSTSPVVGVNILAPENNDVAMQDYWLHMYMFRYMHQKAGLESVKYSMHAGELALGMVKPEDMTWHIHDAVITAGASRIGHGVDIPYESDCYELLKYMRDNKVAVEINLSSNEFILQVSGDKHPINLYREFHVPLVISTDDAGVLRTSMVYQYVLLAGRYHNISYKEIKTYVYNSIQYSFIREPALLKKLNEGLDKQFAAFEKEITDISKN